MGNTTQSSKSRTVMIDKPFTTWKDQSYQAGQIIHDTHNQTLIGLAEIGVLAHFVEERGRRLPAPLAPADEAKPPADKA